MRSYAQTNLQLYGQLRRLGYAPDDVARVRAAYTLCMRLFTGCFRPSGKTFLAHLIGTASVLAQEAAAVDVVVAGLLHAAYSHGDFGTSALGVAASKRALLRETLGARAEEWITRYSAFSWDASSLAALAGCPDLSVDERTLVLMRAANELEELLDLGLADRDGGAAAVARVRERTTLTARLLRAGDHVALADELERALDDRASVSMHEPEPVDPRARHLQGRGSSYVLPPMSYGLRPTAALRRFVRRYVRRARLALHALWPRRK